MGIKTTEFFDKEYTARQAYGRLFQYAKKYKVRLLIGLLAGFTTAMSWMPLFQVIQPVLKHVQTTEAKEAVEEEQAETAASVAEEADAKKAGFKVSLKDMVKREKSAGKLERKDLPGWFNKADSLARKFGLELLDEKGNMTGELLVVAIVVVPLVMLIWLGSMYLNQYCLRCPFKNEKQISSVIELDNNDLVFFMEIKKSKNDYDYELHIYRLKDKKYFLIQKIKEDRAGYTEQNRSFGCMICPKPFKLLKIKSLLNNRILSISNYGIRIYDLNLKENNCYCLIL